MPTKPAPRITCSELYLAPLDAPDEPEAFARFWGTLNAGAQPGWEFQGHLAERDGRTAVSTITLRPTVNNPAGATADALRAVPFRDIFGTAARALPYMTTLPVGEGGHSAKTKAINQRAASAIRGRRKPRKMTAPAPAGREGLSSDFYRQVAELFLQVQAEQGGRGMVDALHEAYGRPKNTIRYWLAQAEKLHYLEPATQGRADRRPGPALTQGGRP